MNSRLCVAKAYRVAVAAQRASRTAPAPAVSANEELREELLTTVDNLGATAAALQMAPAYQDSDRANPVYPSLPWTSSFSDGGEPGDGPDSGSGGGICSCPGYAHNTRFITLNTAIALEAVKDMAEQPWGFSPVGRPRCPARTRGGTDLATLRTPPLSRAPRNPCRSRPPAPASVAR